MQGFWKFLSYNNAVPIAITVLISGAGATFAATNPETIYDTTETVVAVDNTYLANKDLASYTPRIEITGVTEDTENYYVAYRLATIDVVDAVWQDVTKDAILTVAKAVLGEYGDLGVYATEQFKQVVDRQLAYLKEVQEIERRQLSQKVIATSYSGLVGRFLDDSTEVLPGYVPVVTAPPVVLASENTSGDSNQNSGTVAGASTQTQNSSAPWIQILGDNPMRIPIGVSFADLGVVTADDSGYIPIVQKFVDGVEVKTDLVSVDTSTSSAHIIRYVATDTDGNTTTAERLIIVGNPPPESIPTVAPSPTTPRPQPKPAPEPVEEPTPQPEQSEPEPTPEIPTPETPAPEEVVSPATTTSTSTPEEPPAEE